MWNSNNCHSRRWLVMDTRQSEWEMGSSEGRQAQSTRAHKQSTATSTSALPQQQQHIKRKSRRLCDANADRAQRGLQEPQLLLRFPTPACASNTKALKSRWRLRWHRPRPQSTTIATQYAPLWSISMSPAPTPLLKRTRVNACLNQILEVLLALLLANCLMQLLGQLPAATAAFGAAPLAGDTLADAYNFYTSSRSSQSSDGGVAFDNDADDDDDDDYGNADGWRGPVYSNYRQAHSIGGSAAYAFNALQLPTAATLAAAAAYNLPSAGEALSVVNQLQRSQNFKISQKPCSIGRIEGTCMFVWECIKSEGRHVGMCVDTFMFGSCCAHNYTENIVMPQTFSYTRPTKPLGIGGLNHRPRPPHQPHKPSISGMTTIERPHGAGTLVIRPSGPHHQGALHRPQYTKPSSLGTTTSFSASPATMSTTKKKSTTTTTTESSNALWTSNAVLADLQSAAATATASNLWNASPQLTAVTQHHWHMTTEPNFITKPRPPSWEKPTGLRPSKPSKPTKKPILPQPQLPSFQLTHQQQQQTSPGIVFTTTRRPVPPTTSVQPATKKPSSLPALPANTASTTPISALSLTRPKPPFASATSGSNCSSNTSITNSRYHHNHHQHQQHPYQHQQQYQQPQYKPPPAYAKPPTKVPATSLASTAGTSSATSTTAKTTTTTTTRGPLSTTVKTTTRPYTRPTTPSWVISESGVPSSSSSSSGGSSGDGGGGGTIYPLQSTTKQPTTTTSIMTTTTQKHRPTSPTSTSAPPSSSSAAILPIRPTYSPTWSTATTSAPTRPTSSTTTSTSTSSSSSSSSSSASPSTSVTTTHYVPPTYGHYPHPQPSDQQEQQQQQQQHTLSPHNLTTIESNEISDSLTDNSTAIKIITAARSECGIPVLARPETRIVGGKSAAFGRWPWQVSVRRTTFFGFSSTHRCGGALINENWIATAGHCVDDLLISQMRIRVGEYDFSHVQEQLPYIERGVAKKVVHPKYNFFTYEYDLALVKLEQSVEFAPHVSPICLPQTDSLLIGMNATVTGWGRLSEGGTLASVLQEVSVPIVSNGICESMFARAGRQESIPDIFVCAGYENGGHDSCQGDSGGPLQVKAANGRFFLAGIISWGIGCAEANLPGVCTRISRFVPWIMENVS
ncbi:serine proteinase stubble [Rhagoletis pomonella]|uniref:serine proteinase stubble n=1 Tax=Rhagoletis pomonella TaxID=28610 RepID=UPI00177FCD03|nr:serine proteinase stubble [Rhagoletis pomonella]